MLAIYSGFFVKSRQGLLLPVGVRRLLGPGVYVSTLTLAQGWQGWQGLGVYGSAFELKGLG